MPKKETVVSDVKDLAKVEESNDLKTLAANAEKSLLFAQSLKIEEEKDFELANSTIADVKAEIDRGEKTRKFFGDPYRMLVDKINGLFMPPIKTLQQASRILGEKMIQYHNEQARKAEAAKAALAKKIEAGKISPEKAAVKAEAIMAPPKTTQSPITGARTTFVKRRVAVIVDESKIPREYLVPDMTKISKVALAGITIPGVEVKEETSLSNTRSSF